MVIYLEKGFVEKLAELDLTEYLIQDFIRELFQKSREYHLRVGYDEGNFEELLLSGNVFIRNIAENCNTIDYGLRWGDVLDHTRISKHRLFLLSKPEKKDKITDAGYEFFSPAHIAEKWGKYQNTSISASLSNNRLPEDRFSSWADLQRWKHPLNGIVVYDKYILTDKPGQQVNYNLIPLLQEMNKMAHVKKDITIITLRDQVDVNNPGGNEMVKIKRLYDKIRRALPACNLQIVLFYQKQIRGAPHDRFIFTNYFLIWRLAGFNIFGDHNNIWDSSHLEFKSFFRRETLPLFKDKQNELANIFGHLVNRTNNVISYPQQAAAHSINGLFKHCFAQ